MFVVMGREKTVDGFIKRDLSFRSHSGSKSTADRIGYFLDITGERGRDRTVSVVVHNRSFHFLEVALEVKGMAVLFEAETTCNDKHDFLS